MTGGLPSYRQSTFPQDLPPTIFSPASPKVKVTKSEKEADTASIASYSTFSSTISLVKSAAKSSWIDAYKERRASRKVEMVQNKPSRRTALPKDPVSPKMRTAEAYEYLAHR